MKRPRCSRKQTGFTLVEMVVATILLAVGGVAAMMAISASIRTVGDAESYSRAAMLAEMRLAELEAQPETVSSGEQQGDFGEEYPGYTWTQTVEPTDLSDVVRVTVTVKWPMGLRRGQASFTTMLRTGAGS